jgi:single-strand DNA-binding protein
MANFNKVILVGNLTRDPQLSYTPSNTPVCQFGMAVNHRYRDRDGNNKDEVCFVDLNAYGRQGEVINQYMSKGRQMLVEGRLRYRQWTDKDGNNRSKLDVFVTNFTFLGGGSREGGGYSGQRAEGGGYSGQRPEGSGYGAQRGAAAGYGAQAAGGDVRQDAPPPVPADEPPVDDGPPPDYTAGDENPEIPF